MGSGFKDFGAGDVLTAADVDNYLMRQTVMTFASSSARDTALTGVLDEGMVAYLEDVDALTFYDGSAWVPYMEANQTYTPALTATSSNPSLGTGSSAAGDYQRQGHMVTGWVRVGFGTSSSAGSGTYIVSLPVAASSDLLASTSNGQGTCIGSGFATNSDSTSNNVPVAVQLRSTTTVQFINANGGSVTGTAPFGWSDDDVLTFTFAYPI